MGLKDCQIILDNPYNTYYAGQTVNGRVEYTFDSPKKVRGILIQFKGEANTEWSETDKRRDQDGKEIEETERLTGNEEYFGIQYYLLGGKNSKETELPAGSHTYPFTCALPPTLPSSFEGKWGHVRYTIKVTLDRPWKFDQDTKMAFTVITPVDLNQKPQCGEPANLELEKTFCCFCCTSAPLNVVVRLPVSGYVSGQIIPIKAEVENSSNVVVNALKLCFRKRISFHTHQPKRATKKEHEVIEELTMGPIDAGQSRSWEQKIEVPALPPSNLVNCGIIDLDYELSVVAQVGSIHRNLEGIIPITLGTVPLASFKPPIPGADNPPKSDSITDPSMLPTQPVSPASPQPQGGAIGWGVGDETNLYPNIPPPTFAESQFKAKIVGRNESEHTRTVGGNEYAPRYPTYAFTPSAPQYNN